MHAPQSQYDSATAIRTDLGAIFVSLELSRATWLVTSLSPGSGEKMSKHSVRGGDIDDLLCRFAHLQEKARCRTGRVFPIVTIQEAGLDGFWIHRVLQDHGIESHIVDAASLETRTCATVASVGNPPSTRRAGAGACTTTSSQARQAYLGLSMGTEVSPIVGIQYSLVRRVRVWSVISRFHDRWLSLPVAGRGAWAPAAG